MQERMQPSASPAGWSSMMVQSPCGHKAPEKGAEERFEDRAEAKGAMQHASAC
eukprot:CAMPEP_0174737448 /NCGR_PEP_ID=MMETSP1094-20130205/68333_1 /TAXON_ID=156173 /ORGANISM="Chrysochromulina brevifilum, Strain UTEX LB 985" /LENGTH=52 /DNA_ID=CAMNT_0015940679 /DNA_START=148 /DNA_END=307 /DNA_ORIENTATION=-